MIKWADFLSDKMVNVSSISLGLMLSVDWNQWSDQSWLTIPEASEANNGNSQPHIKASQ